MIDLTEGVTTFPADFGFRMPAEWEPHERCWMMWPCRQKVWYNIAKTKQDFSAVAKAIAEFESITVIANSEDAAEAQGYLGPGVEVVTMPIDDSWARDTGPNFLINDCGELAGSTWRFNAWGNKYGPFNHDNEVGRRILTQAGARVFVSDLTAEGGAITVDGEGTVLTTESCLLNTNRNPGWTKEEVEWELCRTLGASKVIWLPGNVDERETDGHVDGLAQYVRPRVVLMETSFDIEHPWYGILQDNIKALQGQADAKGRPIDIALIEDAYGAYYAKDDLFCTSYINSYLANGGVILPKYGVDADSRAKAVYEKLFPTRRVVQVSIDAIACGGGGIHCITQQQPKI